MGTPPRACHCRQDGTRIYTCHAISHADTHPGRCLLCALSHSLGANASTPAWAAQTLAQCYLPSPSFKHRQHHGIDSHPEGVDTWRRARAGLDHLPVLHTRHTRCAPLRYRHTPLTHTPHATLHALVCTPTRLRTAATGANTAPRLPAGKGVPRALHAHHLVCHLHHRFLAFICCAVGRRRAHHPCLPRMPRDSQTFQNGATRCAKTGAADENCAAFHPAILYLRD